MYIATELLVLNKYRMCELRTHIFPNLVKISYSFKGLSILMKTQAMIATHSS